MLRLCVFALVIIKGSLSQSNGNISGVYKALRNDLMKDYDRNARPVSENSNVTSLDVGMHLLSAFEIDETSHTINIDCYMSMLWYDRHLSWDYEKYQNIRLLQVSPSEIWMPDVYEIFNGGQNSDVRQSDFNFIILAADGSVIWYFASAFPGCCKFDYRNYPNDAATCKIVLQAWSLRGDALDIAPMMMMKHRRKQRSHRDPKERNPEWQLDDVIESREVWRSRRNDKIFYPSAQFLLTLNRKTPTLQQQLMWISSIIVVLLTLGMFWIPADIEQKLTVGCVVMIIMTATLLTVSSTVEARQPVIIIASKIHNLMYAVTIAILLEIIAINIQHIKEWKPPEFLLNIFSGAVGRAMLISSAQREAPTLDKMKLSENENGDAMLEKLIDTGNWKTISQALDRVAFLMFILVLSAVPKSL